MGQRAADSGPAVGLLYNPATPELLARAPDLIEFLSVMPDRLWFDFGPGAPGRRFHRTLGAMERIKGFAAGRVLAGHGIGLSLPSAIPLDEGFVAAIAEISRDLGGFEWYSEHLSVFLAPRGSVPNAQAGLGLPLAYDEESYAIVSGKLNRLRDVLGLRILLETGAFFMPVPDSDMTEPAFLNRLYREGYCGALLDLHNIHVSALNDGMPCEAYLEALDPDCVEEIHLGGGDDFAGFYMDSHSSLTPPEVWRLAFDHAPRFRRLRAITFEFQETYFESIGANALVGELERMHELAAACRLETADAG